MRQILGFAAAVAVANIGEHSASNMTKKLMAALPALEFHTLSHASDYDYNGMAE